MATASEVKVGMGLRIDDQIYRVLEVEARAGAAKMGGTVRVRLSNLRSGRIRDEHFRPLERLEEIGFEERRLQFLYGDENTCMFLRLDTFEQVEFPSANLGLAATLLSSGTEVSAEFFEGELINVILPGTVEARVASTAPPARSQQDSGRKEASLESGMKIQVPLFVGPGETVSIDLTTGRYVERVRLQHKKGA